jgi:hypothetical protein
MDELIVTGALADRLSKTATGAFAWPTIGSSGVSSNAEAGNLVEACAMKLCADYVKFRRKRKNTV